LNEIFRETDYISRLGGDEFTIILGGMVRPNLDKVASRILECLSKPYIIQGIKIDFVTPSIGASTYPDDGHDAETLLKHADSAMYKAKEKRNCFFPYSNACTNVQGLRVRKAR
jgi:diguanylate cyclase (GGDEF)-like protein